MISKIQIERYRKFKGDMNDWVKSQKDGLDEILTGQEWRSIDQLVQRLRMHSHPNVTMDYKNETERVLKKTLENDEVIRIARELV
jgi:hypothetical protein